MIARFDGVFRCASVGSVTHDVFLIILLREILDIIRQIIVLGRFAIQWHQSPNSYEIAEEGYGDLNVIV
jgi:hypothetical protein